MIVRKWVDYARGLGDPTVALFSDVPIKYTDVFSIAKSRKEKQQLTLGTQAQLQKPIKHLLDKASDLREIGKFYEAIYVVQNKFNTDITGQAVPSVSPSVASLYFKKSECFCFVNQLLKAGEKQEMLVRFEVDKDLPENVDALTLSYTFFKVKSDT